MKNPSRLLQSCRESCRWFTITGILLLIAWFGSILYSLSFPVYIDSEAPSRISNEIQSHLRDLRFKEWHSRLHAVETPHKRFSDLGQGLCAAGIGLIASVGFWNLYHRWPLLRQMGVILIVWCGLWLLRLPCSIWYYGLRQQRFDYPIWGDSIAIPLASDAATSIVGAVFSSAILLILRIRYPLPAAIQFDWPSSIWGWVRGLCIVCWLVFNAISVAVSIPDGDLGVILPTMIASVILLAFLSAKEQRSSITIK